MAEFPLALSRSRLALNRSSSLRISHQLISNFTCTRQHPSTSRNSTYPRIARLVPARTMASATSFFDFKPLDKRGQEFDLSSLRGKYVLVVNTASKCGFTPQYKGLEALYQQVRARGGADRFEILGFPCNQFGAQEPGSDADIQSFCQINYGVSFPILGKISVNGNDASPLYQWLKKEKPGLMGIQMVKWNFEKFLIDPEGNVRDRWASTTKPETIGKTVFNLLGLPEEEEPPKEDNAKEDL